MMHRNKKKLVLASALIILAGAGAVVAQSGHKEHGEHKGHGEHKEHTGQMTVRGEILDMACYVAHEAKGPDHAACAKRCAMGGQPIGLLTDDGTVYLLYANHDDGSAFEEAKEQAGQNVEIAGAAATKAGIKGLEVHSVKKR